MSEEPELKDIPYGIADFKDFRTKNLYYVDKTRFIRDIEKKGSFLFFIRPRRFGKSLFLSVMEYYYDIHQKDQFDFLFNGTDIHRKPTKEKNKYLVLSFNFSAVDPDKSHLEEFFLQHILDSIRYFTDKYGKYLDIDMKEAQKKFESSKGASALMGTFLNYFRGKEYKLYVIIDEYDNFANTILSDSGETEYRAITHGEGFLRSFFNVIKAGTTGSDTPISRLFMTGVSPITLDDVTSGFNIASNISLDMDIDEIMGFTKTEVETMIEYYRQTGKMNHPTPELFDIMSRWYNHYRFSMDSFDDVFNPVQVMYFLKEYLKTSRLPRDLIDRNIRIDYRKLRHLIVIDRKGVEPALPAPKANGNFSKLTEIIKNGSAHSSIEKGFSINELTNPENFISLLFYFGLLTISGIDEENKAILTIPNQTIKRLYYDYIKETYDETGVFTLDLDKYALLMKEMVFDGKWQPLFEYLARRIEASMSLRDLIGGEKAVQAFLNVYLGLSPLYIVHAEKELNKGFADLVLEPFLAQYPAIQYTYLVEIKYIKAASHPAEPAEEKIGKMREEAENQLKQYCLDEKFQKTIGLTKLVKLVLVFCGHRLVYTGESV